MEKIRYEVDPHNRLVVKKSPSGRGLPRFRNVLDGRFKVGRYNTLTYHSKPPSGGDDAATRQIKLQGTWRLSPNHELVLTLDAWRYGTKDELTLRGDIIDVKANAVIFAMTTVNERGVRSTYALELAGSWQADERNRLTFKLSCKGGQYDTLTFDGIWEMNEHHQILYRYERSQLATKLKRIHTLVFRGHWDITGRSRLSYVIDASTDCVLNFTTGVAVFSGNKIQYEIGIGLSRRAKPVRTAVTLYGTWRVIKSTSLAFEMKYEDQKIRSIVFTAQVDITDQNTLLCRLRKDEARRDIIGELEISHKILRGDGEIFLRLLKSGEESAAYAGAGWRW